MLPLSQSCHSSFACCVVTMVEPTSRQTGRRNKQIAEEKQIEKPGDSSGNDSPDDEERSASVSHGVAGPIPDCFCLKTQEEKWTVTRATLKASSIMPQLSSRDKLIANVQFSNKCNPHYMNRFGLVSWYVFFQYCLNGMIQEKSKINQEVDALKDENAKLKSLCESLHESQSKRHSIDEIQAFKSSIVSNILVPQKIRDVLFHIGFPSTKVSSNFFFSLSAVPTHPSLPPWDYITHNDRSCQTRWMPTQSLPRASITSHLSRKRFSI